MVYQRMPKDEMVEIQTTIITEQTQRIVPIMCLLYLYNDAKILFQKPKKAAIGGTSFSAKVYESNQRRPN